MWNSRLTYRRTFSREHILERHQGKGKGNRHMHVASQVVETKLLILSESKSFIAFGSKSHSCSWEGLQAPCSSHFRRTPQTDMDMDCLESPVQNSDFSLQVCWLLWCFHSIYHHSPLETRRPVSHGSIHRTEEQFPLTIITERCFNERSL